MAKEYFGFKEDDKIISVIDDAYDYINKQSNDKQFDIILMDINYEEQNMDMSPPMKFVETNFL